VGLRETVPQLDELLGDGIRDPVPKLVSVGALVRQTIDPIFLIAAVSLKEKCCARPPSLLGFWSLTTERFHHG